MNERKCHIAMFPWFALSHLTLYTQLANMLAKTGHVISFLVPRNALYKLEPLNLHPKLFSFLPITVPDVEGLPQGAETTLDVPPSLRHLIMTAMDKTENNVERILQHLKVDVVFFDFAHWMPSLCRRIRVKSVNFCAITPVTVAYIFSPARQVDWNKGISDSELVHPPAGYPLSSIKFHSHELCKFTAQSNRKVGCDMTFVERIYIGLSQSNALACNASRELEGPVIDYLQSQFKKPVLLSGPTVTIPPSSTLSENLSSWLCKFNPRSVIYCAFGTECALTIAQMKELLLGFELTNMPFLAALKPPADVKTIDDAIPEGLLERLEGRGLITGELVQQNLILKHKSIGCFVTHCGWASLCKGLVSNCRLVLLPNGGDQIINSRLMSEVYRVGVEVQKGEEDGVFTKNDVFDAVKKAMDENSEVGKEIKEKHAKIREFLLNKDVKSAHIDSFNQELQDIVEL
nr:anthocyanidin 3-O-glucoside 2''-O-glucosyltransferase-like [Tanacetum cinerariifolium]GEX97448.1 anthocyanidin 3-O-glucoside 2''-O-glucosyltransferase-like [Tanacetum cinerariifolium]